MQAKTTIVAVAAMLMACAVAAGDVNWITSDTFFPEGPGGSVRDQYQTTNNGGGYFWASRYLAQTFTCGISAQLSHMNVYIDVWEGAAFCSRDGVRC